MLDLHRLAMQCNSIVCILTIFDSTVFGFFQDSFIGLEQGPGHSVQVGYQKGAQVAAQDLAFNVVSTPGTASEFSVIVPYYTDPGLNFQVKMIIL